MGDRRSVKLVDEDTNTTIPGSDERKHCRAPDRVCL